MAKPILEGTRVALWAPRDRDRDEFLAAVCASRELHGDWVFPPFDAQTFREFLRRAKEADRTTLLARAEGDRRLVGVVKISNIVGGAFSNATLGYYGFSGGVGDGRMTDAVRLATSYCFVELRLHRVEANIQPGNVPSRRLIEHLGFRHEGFSPKMLRVGGEWRDHDRFAITVEGWMPMRRQTDF